MIFSKLNSTILTILVLFIVNISQAQESKVEQVKSKLRGYSSKFLGEELTTKIFGIKEFEVVMPPIPNITSNSKSTYSLSTDSVLAKQGEEFEKKSVEEKRPYQVAFLEEIFEVTRKQKATDEEIGNWLNTLEQGSSREGVYRAMVLDQVYNSLENFNDPPALEVVDFTVSFYKEFFGKDVNADSLRQLNIYSIKKAVAEKALEILEAYEENPEYLYSWYAMLSAKLAAKFSYSNKVRDNKDAVFHFNWAKGVPYQQIKSEMIIKIHAGYNSWLK